MRLRTLRLDRIGRLWAPLVAAALFLGSPSFAPAQAERLPKVGYLGFGASVPRSDIPKARRSRSNTALPEDVRRSSRLAACRSARRRARADLSARTRLS